MDRHGKFYDYEIYEGAGHAFVRKGADPSADAGARAARGKAWGRLERILGGLE